MSDIPDWMKQRMLEQLQMAALESLAEDERIERVFGSEGRDKEAIAESIANIDLTARDERGRNFLGLIDERCPHCQARLYFGPGDQSKPICLNACMLPGWAYREMQAGLQRAAERVERQLRTSDSTGEA